MFDASICHRVMTRWCVFPKSSRMRLTFFTPGARTGWKSNVFPIACAYCRCQFDTRIDSSKRVAKNFTVPSTWAVTVPASCRRDPGAPPSQARVSERIACAIPKGRVKAVYQPMGPSQASPAVVSLGGVTTVESAWGFPGFRHASSTTLVPGRQKIRLA